MEKDKRMYFIRNKDYYMEKEDFTTYEYEVIVDAYIVGEFEYEPYYLFIWEFSPKMKGEERKLLLRIKEAETFNEFREKDSNESTNYYHGGGIADEIISLASLFLRRKLKLGPMVRENDTPMLIDFTSRGKGYIDFPLIEGKSNLKDLANYFKLIEKLKQEIHLKFILATKFYHQAILIIENYPDMAYLNLISSIEVLCGELPIGKVKISDFDEGLADDIKRITDMKLRKKIERDIIKRERFIKRHFINFILENTDDKFWSSLDNPKYGKISSKELPDLLSRIYDQRSKTLHEGQPFPPDILYPPMDKTEIGSGLWMESRGRRWEKQDFLPYPHFFEKLVRHVLMNYLRKNQVN